MLCQECGDEEALEGGELCSGCLALTGGHPERRGAGAYTVPVAFVLMADSDADAALRLVELLGRAADVLGTGYADPLDCWWLPNHPEADGNDNDGRLAWVDALEVPAGVTPPA